MRIEAAEQPHAEIGDDEEQDRTRDRGRADTQRRTPRKRHHADHDDQRDAEIDSRHAVIETEHQVAQQQCAERGRERDHSPAEIGAAEQRHCVDRRKIGRMRHQAKRGGNEDRGEKSDQAA